MENSEIDGAAIDFPVAETGRVCAAASAEFFRHIGFGLRLATFFCFLQGALCRWRKRFFRSALFRDVFHIVVVRALHIPHHRKVY